MKPAAIYMNPASAIKPNRGSLITKSPTKSPAKAASTSSPKSRLNSNTLPSPKPPPPTATTASSVPKPQSVSSPVDCESIYDDFDDTVFDSVHTRLDHIEKAVALLGEKMNSLDTTDDESGNSKISREITSARADMRRMETRGAKAAEDAAKAKSDIAEMKPMIEQLKQMCESMQREIHALNGGSGQGSSVPLPIQPGYMTLSTRSPMGCSGEQALMEANKKFLGDLNFNQVLNLLEMMGLSQHQNSFTTERVNGEILLECDDTVLQHELKMTSKLQRVRLLKIIQGKHSAEMILCGEDPYAYAQPK